MRSTILFLGWIALLLIGCQKRKYPVDDIQLGGEPIYFNGTIDNQPVNLKIGSDGYYCYSSYVQGADSVYNFVASLKKFNCNPCPLSFQLELSDYRLRSPGSTVPADSVFRKGSRSFVSTLLKTKKVRFVCRSNKTVSSLRWDFADGSSSVDSITTYEFRQPGLQTLSLSVQSNEGCKSTVTNKVFVGADGGVFACEVNASLLQNNRSQFAASLVGGKAPFVYTWNFGDGITSSLESPIHDYQWSGSYPVKLQVKDADNHFCESNYIHVAGKDKSSCAANIFLSSAGIGNALLNAIRMQWIDQSNTIFRSDSAVQPTTSYFEVTDSQGYEPNERGESGRLLTMRFNILLSDGKRNIWIKSDNTAITVSYK